MRNFFKRILHFVVVDWAACLLLALVLVVGVAVAVFLQPVVLVVAAGQADQDEQKVVQLLIDTLAKERSGVRLVPLWTNNAIESAAALTAGKADVAVIRSDLVVGRGASSLVSLRKFNPVLLTKKSAKITKLSDLRGKRIGIGGQGDMNQLFFRQILSERGLQEQDYTLVPLNAVNRPTTPIRGK